MTNVSDDRYANYLDLITMHPMYGNITIYPINMYNYIYLFLKFILKRSRTLPCFPGWCQTPELQQSCHLSLPKCCNYRHESLHPHFKVITCQFRKAHLFLLTAQILLLLGKGCLKNHQRHNDYKN